MNLQPPFDRITIDPERMGGQPCIRGTRITVRRLLEILATYPERESLFEDYPDLEQEDIRQAMAFTAANVAFVAKLSTHTEDRLRERAGRGNVARAKQI